MEVQEEEVDNFQQSVFSNLQSMASMLQEMRKSQSYQEASEQLANFLFRFVQQSQRDRIMQRNRVESIADTFDWSNLRSYYDTAHELAVLKKRK